MSKIKFVYLYRDGANYKSWGEVVFTNLEQLTLIEIDARLTDAFMPDKLFIASQVSIPERFLFMDGEFSKDDHCYHEFDSVEICEEDSTDFLGRSITTFLQDVDLASKQGWKVFDILEGAR